jgi:hypothetical protein
MTFSSSSGSSRLADLNVEVMFLPFLLTYLGYLLFSGVSPHLVLIVNVSSLVSHAVAGLKILILSETMKGSIVWPA